MDALPLGKELELFFAANLRSKDMTKCQAGRI